MEINTLADILKAFADAENDRLQAQNIVHRPTIGDMYEGLTAEILNKSLFKGLNLVIAKGSFIKGCQTEMDIVLAEGVGEPIPYTSAFVFDPKQVIAVIQVKKTMNGKELRESYENLMKISDLYVDVPHEEYSCKIATDSVHKTLQRSVNDYKNGLLNQEQEYVYHSLVHMSKLPVTIVLGYNGLKSEFSLRERFTEYLGEKVSTEGNIHRGYGPANFPSLIVCEGSSIVNMNGCPFCSPLREDRNGWWDFLVSSHHNPMYYLLEVIWSKLAYKYSLPPEIFGKDLETPKASPFLATKVGMIEEKVVGWQYYYNYLTNKELNSVSGVDEWHPIELNYIQYKIMNAICIDGHLPISDIKETDEDLHDCGFSTTEEAWKSLLHTGLVAKDGDNLVLISNECQVIMVGSHFLAAENNSGRFDNWLAEHSMELMFG